MSSKIKKFNFKTRKITVMESPELSGCADIFFDKKTNQIFAPLMTLNKVVILPIKWNWCDAINVSYKKVKNYIKKFEFSL